MTDVPKTRLSETPLIHPGATVTASTLGRYTEVSPHTSLTEVELGDYSYVTGYCEIIYTTIGKHCSIAAHARIHPVMHPMQRATQSHFTYRAADYFAGEEHEPDFFDWRRASRVHIGHDVWTGHGAIILAGRRVGSGAVVGAGSVVTRDVAPYTIVGGNPARVLKRRFDERTSERLLSLAWWDWNHAQLQASLPDFRTLPIEAFLEKHGA
jgi:phosphonate metabolism protein (transferase hexapeptide repeat family)